MRSLRSLTFAVLAAILFTTSVAWSEEPARTGAPSEPTPAALQELAPAVNPVNPVTPAVCRLDEQPAAASPAVTSVFWCCEQARCVRTQTGCPFPPAYTTLSACVNGCIH